MQTLRPQSSRLGPFFERCFTAVLCHSIFPHRTTGGCRQLHHAVIGRSWSTPSTDHGVMGSEEHTSELQSLRHLVCRFLLEKKKKISFYRYTFAIIKRRRFIERLAMAAATADFGRATHPRAEKIQLTSDTLPCNPTRALRTA